MRQKWWGGTIWIDSNNKTALSVLNSGTISNQLVWGCEKFQLKLSRPNAASNEEADRAAKDQTHNGGTKANISY